MIGYDDILTNKIKWGKYQNIQFFCVGSFIYLGAFQVFYQLQVLGIFKNTEQYTTETLELLGSMQFLGQMIGYAFYSSFCDKIGRQRLACYSMGLFTLGMFFHSLTSKSGFLVPIRLLLGFTYAINEGIGKTLIVEISPLQIRGQMTSMIIILFVLGVISSGVVCVISWDDFNQGNWQTGFYIFTAFTFISFLLTIYVVKESARFLLANGQFDQALIQMNLMGQMNNGSSFIPITKDEMDQMVQQSKQNIKQDISINSLFAPQIIKITIVLVLLTIIQNLIDKGMVILIPFLSHDSNLKLYDIPLFSSLELFAPVITGIVIEKKYIGRSRGLIVSYFICSISLQLIGIIGEDVVLFCIIFQRFSTRLTWIFLIVIILESYSTNIRTLGFGMCNCIGKAAGAISPFIFLPLYYQNDEVPFFILGILCLINAYVVTLLPIELTQQPLDSIQLQIDTQQSQVSDSVNQNITIEFQTKESN